MKAPDPKRTTKVFPFCFTWCLSFIISSLEGEEASTNSGYYIFMVSLWTLTGFVLWCAQATDYDGDTFNNDFNFDLPAGFPLRSCNQGYYRTKRRDKHYNLRQRAAQRPQERPVRDKVFTWWDTTTWRWPGTRRTPILIEQDKTKWWDFSHWFHKTKNKRTNRQFKSRRIKRSKQERSLKSRKHRRQHARDKTNKSWSHAFGEAEQQQKSDFAQFKHKLLHQSWIMYDMQFGVSIHDLIDDIDPSRQWRMIKRLHQMTKGASTPLSTALLRTSQSQGNRFQLCCIALANWVKAEGTIGIVPTHDNVVGSKDVYSNESTLASIYQADQSGVHVPVVLDTGASFSITPFLNDFVGQIQPSNINSLNGLSSKTSVSGVGTVEWPIRDVFGVVRTLRTSAYYVPDATIRLFSPQVYFQENQGNGSCLIEATKATVTMPDGTDLVFLYNLHNNLPMMVVDLCSQHLAGLSRHDMGLLSEPAVMDSYLSVLDQVNQNITSAQKELLLWHQKLGHAGFQWNQSLMTGDEPMVVTKHAVTGRAKTENLICTACAMAKMGQRHRTRQTKPAQFEDTVLRTGDLIPGDKVSIDQYISALPGRLPNTKGKEPKKDRYHGGTIFVDHASQYVYLRSQVSLTTGETLQSKKFFEQFALTSGVKIKSYWADNVPFDNEDFRSNIQRNNQTIDFSGVGAHHQNGVAERAIQTITSWARTMMLHSIIMWPDQADLALWPFALDHAVYLWNNMPQRESRMSPLELFTGQKFPSYDHLQRLHVWGCPVYVLDPKLQDGKKIPKWQPRACRGQFLGYSKDHSTTIGMVLNIATGHVSPQFHVVYDDFFTSVPNAEHGGLFEIPDFDANLWEKLVESGHERYLDEGDGDRLPPLHDSWLTPAERNLRVLVRHRRREARRERNDNRQRNDRGEEQDENKNVTRRLNRPVVADRLPPDRDDDDDIPVNNDGDEQPDLVMYDDDESDTQSLVDDGDIPPNQRNDADDKPITTTRSGRRVQPPKRLIENCLSSADKRGGGFKTKAKYDYGRGTKDKVSSSSLNKQFLMAMKWNRVVDILRSPDLSAMNAWMEAHTDPEHDTIEEWHPFALASQVNAADNPTWEQAMTGPDKAGY
jgi:hypothetical protein